MKHGKVSYIAPEQEKAPIYGYKKRPAEAILPASSL